MPFLAIFAEFNNKIDPWPLTFGPMTSPFMELPAITKTHIGYKFHQDPPMGTWWKVVHWLTHSLTHWLTHWVTRSPIELSWTAKKVNYSLSDNLKSRDAGASKNLLDMDQLRGLTSPTLSDNLKTCFDPCICNMCPKHPNTRYEREIC